MAEERVQNLPSYVRVREECDIGSYEVCEFGPGDE